MAKSEVNNTKKDMSAMYKRIISALVMLPVVIGTLWVGYPYVDILALIVGVLLSFEWINMVSPRKPLVYFGAYLFALSIALFVFETKAIVLSIIFTTLFVFLKSRKEKENFLITLGVPYISVGVGSLAWMYHDIFAYAPYNFYMTLWFLLMLWAMDVGAYIVGTNVKGPKLAPSISPNKTWSGLIGGIILAGVISYAFFYVLSSFKLVGIDSHTQIFFIFLGSFVAGISQIGDLIESAMKRHFGLKDSSQLIPGHGGIFDRVDGLIFAAPFVYFLFAYALSYI